MNSQETGDHAERLACSSCPNRALRETIERNSGLCEVCASERREKEKGGYFISSVSIGFGMASFLLPLGIAGYVFCRCHQADWPLFWNLVWFVLVFFVSFQGVGYLIGAIAFVLEKMGIGFIARQEADAEEEIKP